MKKIFALFFALFYLLHLFAQEGEAVISGRVVDASTQQPIPFATVIVYGTTRGDVTDEKGYFTIERLLPNNYRVTVSYLGYDTFLSSYIPLFGGDFQLDISLQPSAIALGEVSVRANPFRKPSGAPLAMQLVGFEDIDKGAGGNRDISRVVTAFPGVGANVSAGYRNDLLVRGGGPSENRFYLDGVEIPNINHFSTQGASGGPTSILNADFIREVEFYTGAFPVYTNNALSSVLSFKMKEGDRDRHRCQFTLGASEVAASSSGSLSSCTTYLVSLRRSYLQLLFKLLDLPFLPTYTDAQFKVKSRINSRHEITVLGLGGIDRMSLNREVDPADEAKQYLVNSLPVITQNSFTLGAVYKYYGDEALQQVVLSHNYLQNGLEKFKGGDETLLENLQLDYHAIEQESHLRYEYRQSKGVLRLSAGGNLDLAHYRNRTLQQRFTDVLQRVEYETELDLFRWGIFASVLYVPEGGAYTLTAALRTDANSYSHDMNNPLKQLSPRLSASFRLIPNLYLNGHVGVYYQLPSYTTMGYKDSLGVEVNRETGLSYLRCSQMGVGVEYRLGNYARATIEGFYKHYTNGALSLTDSIPLACKGADYGVTGDEAVTPEAQGRSYGVELMFRWVGEKNLNLLASYTWFRSLFYNPRGGEYIPSAWDNQHLFTLTSSYKFRNNWSIGLKYRVVGGNPYTPYDEAKSSLIVAWDVAERPFLDYARYNEERLPLFTQLDIRVDKGFTWGGVELLIYLDIQNVLNQSYVGQPAYISTGIVDDTDKTRYQMKYIPQIAGQLLPTIGATVVF